MYYGELENREYARIFICSSLFASKILQNTKKEQSASVQLQNLGSVGFDDNYQ